MATQGLRQPGSSLKPFVYLDTFKKGYTPDTVLFDVPTEFSTDSSCPGRSRISRAPTKPVFIRRTLRGRSLAPCRSGSRSRNR